VQDFVGFEVKGPVAGAIVEGDGLLLAEDKAFHRIIAADALVPLGGNDADFGIANGAEHGFGVVLARAEGNDEFIHERENGADGRNKRVAELLAVPQKSEPADFHGRSVRLRTTRFKLRMGNARTS
jgi:hypothetical protein